WFYARPTARRWVVPIPITTGAVCECVGRSATTTRRHRHRSSDCNPEQVASFHDHASSRLRRMATSTPAIARPIRPNGEVVLDEEEEDTEQPSPAVPPANGSRVLPPA